MDGLLGRTTAALFSEFKLPELYPLFICTSVDPICFNFQFFLLVSFQPPIAHPFFGTVESETRVSLL